MKPLHAVFLVSPKRPTEVSEGMAQIQVERTVIRRASALILFLLICLPLLPANTAALAPEAPNLPDTSHAQAVIVYNLEYDAVLFEKNADKVLFPASTVKIMTGLLVAELLLNRMNDTVIITEEMLTGTLGNTMKLTVGESVSVMDLYYGAVTGGYNDACTALAVIASGSVDSFVAQMNEKAASLGMVGTIYSNPTGLHSATMVTTARDTLLLSLAAGENELYMRAASAVKYTISQTNASDERVFYNRNYLIASAVTTAYHNPYVEGLNGGMTDEGGWCVSAKAYRYDLTWFCVVLGGEADVGTDTIYSYEITNKLLSWAARGYEPKTVVTTGTAYASLPVSFASIADESEDGIPLKACADLTLLLPLSTAEGETGLSLEVRLYNESLDAPVKEGSEAGVLIALWNGQELGRVPLVTARSVSRSAFTYTLHQMKELPKRRTFMASLIAFLILLALYIFRCTRFRGHRKRIGRYVRVEFRPPSAVPSTAQQISTEQYRNAPPSDPYADAANAMKRRNGSVRQNGHHRPPQRMNTAVAPPKNVGPAKPSSKGGTQKKRR